jgi:ectoine hydroxylase-related dioxygenase (phytanoyl-CoA dioxygenase family)
MIEGISKDNIEAFHRDGAVLLKGVLEPTWLALLEAGIQEALDNPDGMSAGVDMPLRIDQFPASRSPTLQRLMDESPIASIVGEVVGESIRFYMDQMFYKPPGILAPSKWHQDTCYYNVAGEQLIRAWVCADPVPRDASIEVLRGSHRWNITYRPPVGREAADDPAGASALEASHAAGERLIGLEAHKEWTYFDSFLDDTLPELPEIEAHRDSFDILGWDYEPGDVLLFHGHVVHSARGGAELTHPRRAHASLWAGPDVHYTYRRSQVIPDPVALYEHQPREGQLLSEFPDVFPVGWSPADGK